MLVLLTVGCAPDPGGSGSHPVNSTDSGADSGSDSGTDSGADSGTDSGADSGDSADTGLPPNPWDAAGFWTDPGPLAALVAADPAGASVTFTVRLATSADGLTWTPVDQVVSTDFNSLDLYVTDAGIILTGVVGSSVFATDNGSVYALASSDLSTWSSHEWPISGRLNDSLVDPSMHLRPDGTLGLAYFSTATFGMDPVEIPGQHEIRRAAWNGTEFVEDPGPCYADEGLVDPVICAWNGAEWLFATRSAAEVVVAKSDDSGLFARREDLTWADHTVPFCRAEEADVRVVAQAVGEKKPVSAATVTESALTDQGEAFPLDLWGGNSCSSPVYGKYGSTWLYFCAVRM